MIRGDRTRPMAVLAVLAAAVALALTAAACSGGNSENPTTPPPASAVSVTPLTPGGDSPPTGPTVATTLSDFQFSPSIILMTSVQGLVLTNASTSTLHNFSVPKAGIDIDIQPGATNNISPIGGAVQPGTYAYYCKYHNTKGMVGVITVDAATP